MRSGIVNCSCDFQDHLDLAATPDSAETRVHPDLTDNQEVLDLRVHEVRTGSEEPRVNGENPAPQAHPALMADLDLLDHADNPDPWDLPDLRDHKAQEVNAENLDNP